MRITRNQSLPKLPSRGIESGCAGITVIGLQYPQTEEKVNWGNKMQKYIRDEKMHRVREIQYSQEREKDKLH